MVWNPSWRARRREPRVALPRRRGRGPRGKGTKTARHSSCHQIVVSPACQIHHRSCELVLVLFLCKPSQRRRDQSPTEKKQPEVKAKVRPQTGLNPPIPDKGPVHIQSSNRGNRKNLMRSEYDPCPSPTRRRESSIRTGACSQRYGSPSIMVPPPHLSAQQQQGVRNEGQARQHRQCFARREAC